MLRVAGERMEIRPPQELLAVPLDLGHLILNVSIDLTHSKLNSPLDFAYSPLHAEPLCSRRRVYHSCFYIIERYKTLMLKTAISFLGCLSLSFDVVLFRLAVASFVA